MKLADLSAQVQRVARTLRRIIGVPDYEGYLAHVQECHAGMTPMTREEFEKDRLEGKYNRPGQRCC